MERIKLLLMFGGTFILVGIILRLMDVSGVLPIIMFLTGGLLKAMYMVIGVRSGRFRIGSEIVLLIVGVVLVLAGVFIKTSAEYAHMYAWLLISGIVLKTTFIVLFFRKQRKQVVQE